MIEGQILDFKAGNSFEFINIKTYDLTGMVTKRSFALKKDGKFAFKVFLA